MSIVPYVKGDRVRLLRSTADYYEYFPEDPYSRGTIIAILPNNELQVRWDAWAYYYKFHAYVVEPLCANCLMIHEEHAADGKCLYAPTYWKGADP